MPFIVLRAVLALAFASSLAAAASCLPAKAAAQDMARIARGRYLVIVGGCSDCHTSGGLTGKPDGARYLGGSDVGFAIPGRGVFVGPNLTPDRETGLGNWTTEQIVTALTTGTRPDGRRLAPVMPWPAFSHLTRSDAVAIAVYLKSLKPVRHAVPGPFGPGQKVDVPVMTVLPAAVYNALPKPGADPNKGR